MLRLIGTILVVFLAMAVLRQLPVVGVFFQIPLLGFFLAAILVGLIAERLGTMRRRRVGFQRVQRELGAVDTPRNRGKLGSLLLSQGRHRAAIGHLRAAARGEPEVAEWAYRLGCALLGAGQVQDAAGALGAAVELDPNHAYGVPRLRRAEALTVCGHHEEAFEELGRFERDYGPSPESAYRRGQALRRAGRKREARDAFAEVGGLASAAVRYQKSEARLFALRALVARTLC
ncbi:MAG TPA: tetratricopeptide repeat protein [Planctomycetota bacterium]|nr:tetratricopeptide repeat protein [Planctomycetota bacterium]